MFVKNTCVLRILKAYRGYREHSELILKSESSSNWKLLASCTLQRGNAGEKYIKNENSSLQNNVSHVAYKFFLHLSLEISLSITKARPWGMFSCVRESYNTFQQKTSTTWNSVNSQMHNCWIRNTLYNFKHRISFCLPFCFLIELCDMNFFF